MVWGLFLLRAKKVSVYMGVSYWGDHKPRGIICQYSSCGGCLVF